VSRVRVGTVSHGTLKTEDLFEAVYGEARALKMSREDRAKARRLEREFRPWREDQDIDGPEILDNLWDLVNQYAPPYLTLRAHEGDGSDIGWWPEIDLMEEDVLFGDGRIAKVPAGEPWPLHEWEGDIPKYVMEVNDHGNVSLKWGCNGREIWSCV